MTTDDSNGRVTIREVYDLLAEFRNEFNAKFDELPRVYASLDAVNAHEKRISALESSHLLYVPTAVHDLCRSQVTTIEDDLKKLQQRVWFIAGGAAVIGAVASPLLAHFL